jgi:(p)ppGpp synthase/HD superfamily hydrolase
VTAPKAAEVEANGLSEAIVLAADAHRGQVDKAGQPYILHVLRVMLACKRDEQRIAAALHDVVEDCGYLAADLAPEFGDTIADAVDALSRREGETYAAFIDRCALNPIARVVKLADLADNMDLSRIRRKLTDQDFARMKRYEVARATLLAAHPSKGE